MNWDVRLRRIPSWAACAAYGMGGKVIGDAKVSVFPWNVNAANDVQ